MNNTTVLSSQVCKESLHKKEGKILNYENNYKTGSNKNSQRSVRLCAHCNKPIHNNALRALGSHYHEECLVCYDCGTVCKPKYFPYELPDSGNTVLLCQKHYFTRNNLLCSVCNEPLNGVYFSTFGKLYDEEHFCCSLCAEKCKVDECFHHDDKLYCKYHFLKYISRRCQGCGYPISDQYIEFPKGDNIECWHTECYGIHKYWHVTISPQSFGLSVLKGYDLTGFNKENDKNAPKSEMEKSLIVFNTILSKIWTVLYRFEEETANCVSDMFQYLASLDQKNGLDATALLVLKLSCLLNAIDSLDSVRVFADPSPTSVEDGINNALTEEEKRTYFQKKQTKIPNKLSTKILIYLQLLRKMTSNAQSGSPNEVNSFISVITGIAQFLKLLIRESLTNALEYCKRTKSSNTLLKYLKEIEANEIYYNNPFQYINVSIEATDSCFYCGKYIKEGCYQYGNSRWHKECLYCNVCQKFIDAHSLSEASFNVTTSTVHCARCSVDDPDSKTGLKSVSNFSQLVYILQIALVRSKTVMEYNQRTTKVTDTSNPNIRSITMQQTYIRTLNDIKRLKSRRTSMKVSYNKEGARKSRVIETQERRINQDIAGEKDLVIETDEKTDEKQNFIFDGTRSLTLDDISRIVAAEKSRELIPTDQNTDSVKRSATTIKHPIKNATYYSELTVEQYYKLQVIAFTVLINEGVDTDDIKIPDTHQKLVNSNGLWTKFKTIMGGKESKKVSLKKVFGSPLEYLTVNCGVESDLGVGPSKLKVPILVDEIISSLRQLDMSVEGIFRKNGNIRRLKLLVEEIDSQPQSCPDLSKESVIQLSALLKKFLRELPNPLLTFDLYKQWIKAMRLTDAEMKKKILGLLYTMLPIHHRNVAEVLFSFLYWAPSFSHVDNHSGSKMDIHNISTVITPNILYKDNDMTKVQNVKQAETYADAFAENEGEEYYIAIETVEYCITHNEELSKVPKLLVDLLKEVEQANIESTEGIAQFVKSRL